MLCAVKTMMVGKSTVDFSSRMLQGPSGPRLSSSRKEQDSTLRWLFFFFFFSWRLRKSSYIFQTKHIRWRFSVIERILRPPGLYLTLLTEVSGKVLIISQPPPPGPHFAFNVESNGVEALNVRAPKTLCLIRIPAFSLHGHVTLGNLQA